MKSLEEKQYLALTAFEENRFEDAENIIISILKKHPHDPWSLHFLGCLKKQYGDFNLAIKLIKKSIDLDPNDPIKYLNLAKIFERTSRPKDSLISLESSLKLNQQIPETWFCLGNTLRVLEKHSDAILAYKNALTLNPYHAGAAGNLGALLLANFELDEAINFLSRAQTIDPNAPANYINLGHAWRDKGDTKKAIQAYETALKIDPNHVDTLIELAGQFKAAGAHSDSINTYQKAVAIDPTNANAVAGLGWSFLENNLKKEAIEYYSHSLQTRPTDVNTLFFLFESLKGKLAQKHAKSFSYLSQSINKTLELLEVNRILAFGDSHVLYFSDILEVEVNHVGASTAYNLLKESSSTGGRNKIMRRLSRANPSEDAILLCFGEVDIRANAIKYCYQKGITIEEVINDIAKKYISFAKELSLSGFQILIFGGYGAGNDRCAFGSDYERNFAAKILHKHLESMCSKNKFTYFSLHDLLFDETNLETDTSFLSDNFHLFYKSQPAKREIQLLLFERIHASARLIYPRPKKETKRLYILGNADYASKLIFGYLEDGIITWETRRKEIYSLTIDLGARVYLDSIIIETNGHADFNNVSIHFDGIKVRLSFQKNSEFTWTAQVPYQFASSLTRYPSLHDTTGRLSSIKKLLCESKNFAAQA